MGRRVAVFRRVLSSAALRRVVLAFLGFSCAEHGTWVSITVFAYTQGGAGEAAVISVVQLVPAAAVAPWAARLADRRGGGTALTVGYVAQAVTMAATAAALLTGADAPVVYAGAVLAACAVTMTRPAQSALVPGLVRTPAELTAVNAATGWLESVSLFVGPTMAGVLIGLSGPGAAFALFAAGSAAAAALVLPLSRAGGSRSGDDDDAPPGRAVWKTLRAHPGAAALIGVVAVQFVGFGALDVLVVVLAQEVLELDAGGAGYLYAAFGAGGIVGGAGGLWLVGRRQLVPPLLGAVAAWGVAFALVGLLPSVAAAFVLLAAAGASWTMLDVSARTLLQRVVPSDVRGRVFGVVEGMSSLALALGALLVGVLTELGGGRLAIAAVGAALVLAGAALVGSLRGLDAEVGATDAQLALLRRSSLFDVLAPPVIEDLGRALEPVTAAPGTAVITQGDHGETYFVVETGSLEVRVDDRRVGELGPGDGFGEIALLRDGVRTSTVIAREPTTLYALARGPFLEAVTGHPDAHRAAESLAEERLMKH